MKLSDILKASGNKYATIASDGIDGSDVKGFIDTGSYGFNALVSGSLYGGFPNNKILALAGESATGKCARGSQKIEVYMTEETAKRLKIE